MRALYDIERRPRQLPFEGVGRSNDGAGRVALSRPDKVSVVSLGDNAEPRSIYCAHLAPLTIAEVLHIKRS
jgi:hypothetical protein